MPEAMSGEVHQLIVEEQVQEALQKILPLVFARLMPDLVSAAPVQASRSDHNEGAVVVDRAEEESEDETQVSGSILHHTQPITGKGLTDYDLSDDEDDALTYTLSMEEVRKVAQQQYIDFSAMFLRHQKKPIQRQERTAKIPSSSRHSCECFVRSS